MVPLCDLEALLPPEEELLPEEELPPEELLPLYFQFAITETDLAGMVKVVPVLEASASVTPSETDRNGAEAGGQCSGADYH